MKAAGLIQPRARVLVQNHGARLRVVVAKPTAYWAQMLQFVKLSLVSGDHATK